MSEAEIYRLLAHPLVLAISVLSFSNAPWRKRAVDAFGAAIAGVLIGLVALWAKRAGAPVWTGWATLVAVLALVAISVWLRRNRGSTRT